MPQNWKIYKLGEICTIKYGKDHKKLEEGKIPCYGTGGIMRYVESALSEEESVLIPRKGSLNNIYYIDVPFWTVDTLFWTKINKEILFPRFFYYNLKTLDFASRDVGSAIPSLTTDLLNRIEVDLPPLQEQKAIASILSAIDDKIENNLAMNKTLEEMAMALYKHWFVDFGPFQDGEFVPSELGDIPKGWEVTGLLEIVDLLTGGTPKTKVEEYWNGEIGWVSAKDLGTNGSVYANETERTITQLGIDKSAAKILPDDTVVIVARGSVGKMGMLAKPMAINQSCFGLYPKEDFTPGLVYLLTCTLIQRFQSISYGSVFDTITTSSFSTTKVITPPRLVVEALAKLIDPMFRTIKQNTLENISLSKLRDTLLPKLISGEVRVKDAEKTVANAL